MEPTQLLTLDEIDLSSQEFWSLPLDVREGAFKTLREERPMPFFEEPVIPESPIPPGPGYYALTKMDQITEASRRADVFSSARGATSIQDMPDFLSEFFGSMINMDDPRHARLRRIVSRGFTPRMLKQLEDNVQQAATDIVDRVLAKGECDFVTDVAAQLPLKIICDMMGIPESDYQFVFDRSNIILGAGDPEYVPEGTDVLTALLTAGQDLVTMVSDLGDERSRKPTDDLTSALVNADLEGERLTGQELGSFFILLVVAGNETTRNAISHGLDLLTKNPDQQALWASDFENYAPTAVEEIVRIASPVIWMRRSVTQDTTLAGRPVKEGDKLLLFYWSANRDADVFDDPFRFDITRTPNDHVGFGGAGPHFCLGAHLARREITVMFRELLRRVPEIAATAEPDRLQSPFINGIKHLPCQLTGAGAA
jgi:cytochrome P450